MLFTKKRLIGLIVLLTVIVAIPLTVWIGQKQQEIRQRAQVQIQDVELYFSSGDNCSNRLTNSFSPGVNERASFSVCLNTLDKPITGYDLKINLSSIFDKITINEVVPGNDALRFNTPLYADLNRTNKYIHLASISNSNSILENNGNDLHLAKISLTANSIGQGNIHVLGPISDEYFVTSELKPRESLTASLPSITFNVTESSCVTDNGCPDDKSCRNGICSDPICLMIVDTECRRRVLRNHACSFENVPNGTTCSSPANATCQNGECVPRPTVTATPTPTTPQPTVTLTPTPTPTTAPPTATTKPFIPEDIVQDHAINILDFQAWYDAYKGNPTRGTFPDVNKDRRVNLLDFNLWFIKFREFSGGSY